MPDKKITELTEAPQLAQNDLFVVVTDTAGTPITKKITASTVFEKGVRFVTNGTYAGKIAFRSLLTANVSASNMDTGNTTVVAGEFITNATPTSVSTLYQYGVRAVSALSGATANVATEHAVAKFVLDVSNSGSLITNTYVALLHVANTDTRVANVQAFIGFGDAAANSTTAQTRYLLDIGLNGAANVSVSTAGPNTTTLLSNTSNGGTVAATHKVRVRINGADYWLLAANASATNL